MNRIFKPLKLEWKNDAFLFIFTLFLVLPLFACKDNNHSISSNISKPKTMSDDKKQLETIISQLNSDYKAIIGMYDLDMEVFVSNREQYIKNYSAILSKMDYLDNTFKERLVNKLKDETVSSEISNLRPLVDPLFQATYAAEKIQIQGVDIEDNMASVAVQLYDSFDKITSSFTNLFFDKNEEGKWILSGNEISENDRKRFPTLVDAEKIIGLYIKENDSKKSYNISKEGKSVYLEFCESECHKVGEIKEVQMPEFLNYNILMKNISGEIIPTYKLSSNKLSVYEYNVEKDQWENNTYIFSEGEG